MSYLIIFLLCSLAQCRMCQIEDTSITRFTSSTKDRKWSASATDVMITTYSMISHSGKRAADSQAPRFTSAFSCLSCP